LLSPPSPQSIRETRRRRSRELDRPRQRAQARPAVRLGWQHELAHTGRPITAAFAGAPGNSFTVFGATPARDAAVVGFQAVANIAAATQVYLRYDGGVGGGTDNHAINVGVRFTW
jgi:uncharacterized protein with beta-barrel porin domain